MWEYEERSGWVPYDDTTATKLELTLANGLPDLTTTVALPFIANGPLNLSKSKVHIDIETKVQRNFKAGQSLRKIRRVGGDRATVLFIGANDLVENGVDEQMIALSAGTYNEEGLFSLCDERSKSGGSVAMVDLGAFTDEQLTDAMLGALARRVPGLTDISLAHNTQDRTNVSDQGAVALAGKCPLLSKINFTRCAKFTDMGLRLICELCSQLSSLTLDKCPLLTESGLQSIAELCPNLSYLSLIGCTGINDSAIGTIQSGSCPTLEYLNISGCQRITDEGLSLFQEHPVLKFLGLGGLTKITGSGIVSVIQKCPVLTDLNISSCPLVTEDWLSIMASKIQLLERLNLADLQALTDDGIETMMGVLGSRIQSLDISCCTGMTNGGLMQIATKCPVLRRLSLRCCNFNRDGVEVAARSLTCLTELDLTGFRALKDSGAVSIALSCPSLKSINLSGCSAISDVGVGTFSCCLDLTSFILSKCALVTDSGIQAVAMSCCALEHLDLSGCKKITNAVGKILVDHCPALRFLSLSGCIRFSDEGLSALSQLKEIRSLNLIGCKVSNAGLSALAANGSGSLEALYVLSSSSIETGLLKLFSNCPQLAYLHISSDSGGSAAFKSLETDDPVQIASYYRKLEQEEAAKSAQISESSEVKRKERWAVRQALGVQARVRANIAEALAGPPMPTFRSMPDASPREVLEAKLAHPAAKAIARHLQRFINAASASSLFDAQLRWDILDHGEGQWRNDGDVSLPERLRAFLNDLIHRMRSNPLWLPEVEPAPDNLPVSKEVNNDEPTAQEATLGNLWETTRAVLEEIIFERVPALNLRTIPETLNADEKLHHRLSELSFLRPEHLEIEPLMKAMEKAALERQTGTEPPSVDNHNGISEDSFAPEALWGAAAAHLWRMADDSATPSPSAKLQEVVAATDEVTRTLARFLNGEPASADHQLPALMLAILHANPPRLRSAIWVVSEYALTSSLGQGAYHVVSLRSAVAWLLSDRPESVRMPEGTTFEREVAKGRKVLADRIQAEIDAEDGKIAHELGMIKTQAHAKGLRVVQNHLDKFLDNNPYDATYEAWIFSLHPENTSTSKVPGEDARELAASAASLGHKIDHRFYLPDADHLNLWNNHRHTELRRVQSCTDSNEKGGVAAANKIPGALQLECEEANDKSAVSAPPRTSLPAPPIFSSNYV